MVACAIINFKQVEFWIRAIMIKKNKLVDFEPVLMYCNNKFIENLIFFETE